MKDTAVKFLIDEISCRFIISEELRIAMYKAIEMEKEQMKIFQIDKELFTRLPIEGINCTSFNVNEHRYFATKYYIDNFKETFKSE